MDHRPFEKVMAANRGEIAIRIFRACYDLDIRTLAIYSKGGHDEPLPHESRRGLSHRRAPQAPWGLPPIDEIIALAKKRGVDAIHPGYGFLSGERGLCPGLRGGGHQVHRPAEPGPRPHGRQARGQEDRRGLRRSRHPRHAREPLKNADEALEKGRRSSATRHPQGGRGRRRAACGSAKKPRTSPRPSSSSRTRRAQGLRGRQHLLWKYPRRAQAHRGPDPRGRVRLRPPPG